MNRIGAFFMSVNHTLKRFKIRFMSKPCVLTIKIFFESYAVIDLVGVRILFYISNPGNVISMTCSFPVHNYHFYLEVEMERE